MEWIKLDTAFFTHPKALKAGANGRILGIVALCWTARHEQDGYLPRYALPQLAFEAGLPIDEAEEAAKRLVGAGLWDSVAVPLASGDIEEGWAVHNYEKHQVTREALESHRAALRERQRRSRAARDAKIRAQAERESNDTKDTDSHIGHGVSHGDVTRDSHVIHVAEESREEKRREEIKEKDPRPQTAPITTPPVADTAAAAEAAADTSEVGLPVKGADPLTDERFATARELCELIADRYATHSMAPARRKVTKTDVQQMDLLLRRGPADLEGDNPIPAEKIRGLLDLVFTRGAVPSGKGFCWADQIRSGSGLREKWSTVRAWANAEVKRMQTEAEPAHAGPRYTVGGYE